MKIEEVLIILVVKMFIYFIFIVLPALPDGNAITDKKSYNKLYFIIAAIIFILIPLNYLTGAVFTVTGMIILAKEIIAFRKNEVYEGIISNVTITEKTPEKILYTVEYEVKNENNEIIKLEKKYQGKTVVWKIGEKRYLQFSKTLNEITSIFSVTDIYIFPIIMILIGLPILLFSIAYSNELNIFQWISGGILKWKK